MKIFSVKSLVNREIIDFPQLCKHENVSARVNEKRDTFPGIAHKKELARFPTNPSGLCNDKNISLAKKPLFYLTKMGVNVCAGRCAVL